MMTFRPIGNCPITGTAELRVEAHKTGDTEILGGVKTAAVWYELVWTRADPEIHVAEDLIDSLDPDGFAAFTRKYKIGERCVYDPSTLHARLQDQAV